MFRFEYHKSTVSNFMFYLKVGDAIVMFESHVPPTLKSRTYELYGAVRKEPEAAKAVVTIIQHVDVMENTKEVAKALYVKSELRAKNLYNKYKPAVVELSLSAWYRPPEFHVVPKVMEVLIRPTAYCVQKKYNYGIHYLCDGVSLGFTLCFKPLRLKKNLWFSLMEEEALCIIRFSFLSL